MCVQLHSIIAKKQEFKLLGTSIEQEAKHPCASIPEDLGDDF